MKKEKGPVVENLHIIQLIEADLQFLLKGCVTKRKGFKIGDDVGVWEVNYRSKLYYSIKNIILGKRLVYDNSILLGNKTIYNITDL